MAFVLLTALSIAVLRPPGAGYECVTGAGVAGEINRSLKGMMAKPRLPRPSNYQCSLILSS